MGFLVLSYQHNNLQAICAMRNMVVTPKPKYFKDAQKERLKEVVQKVFAALTEYAILSDAKRCKSSL